ncbi:hypothetical protein D3C71_1963160 [compost metagenome]
MQLVLQISQQLLAETRAYVSRILQAAVRAVHAQQQRPKPRARTLWVGVSTNHKLLAMGAFELDPVTAAARHIGAVFAFADHTFKPQLAGR